MTPARSEEVARVWFVDAFRKWGAVPPADEAIASLAALLQRREAEVREEACAAICGYCGIPWPVEESSGFWHHRIPKKDRDSSGRGFVACQAAKIRAIRASAGEGKRG